MKCPKCFGTEQMIITENGIKCNYADCQHEINVFELKSRAEKAEGELARVRGITAEQIDTLYNKTFKMRCSEDMIAFREAILTLIKGEGK